MRIVNTKLLLANPKIAIKKMNALIRKNGKRRFNKINSIWTAV